MSRLNKEGIRRESQETHCKSHANGCGPADQKKCQAYGAYRTYSNQQAHVQEIMSGYEFNWRKEEGKPRGVFCMGISHIGVPLAVDHGPGKADIDGAVPCRTPLRYYDKIIG